MASNKAVKVDIRGLAVGGAGVGQVCEQEGFNQDLLGITAFVPYTIPGERVEAWVTQRKKRHLDTELKQVETASPYRVEAPCEYFGRCGGCELQHISYPQQLEAKNSMILGALRAGRLPYAAMESLQPMIDSPPFAYRRRISLHLDRGGRIGFFRAGSRSIVPVSDCLVATDAIRETIPKLESVGKDICGAVSAVEIASDDHGAVVVLRAPYELGEREVESLMRTVKKSLPSVVCVAAGKQRAAHGRDYLELLIDEARRTTLRLPAASFSQVNWTVNKALASYVGAAVVEGRPNLVHDLYAGAGNFALVLAKRGVNVVAVECDEQLAAFGAKNAGLNGVADKLSYKKLSVEKFLDEHRKAPLGVVVADPPRSGLGSLVGSLDCAEKLILISCSLPSFARDLRALTERGWTVREIQPFDMFAQTSHVEIAAICTR